MLKPTHLTLTVVLGASLLAACGTQPIKESPSGDATTKAPTDNTHPGVNSVGYDRDMWQQLLTDAPSIRRSVFYTPTGVQAVTESDDPAVAARIKEHAFAMQARMKTGARVRVWDQVFQELFDNHAKVRLEVTPTEKGVRIVEAADSPEVAALLWSHAAGVSDFVREGHEAGRRATARIAPGTPPPPEVTFGGVRHRILLSQPSAQQLASLKAAGADEIINFRKPSEHPEFDESSAAAEAGLGYCSLPFGLAEELTDDIITSTRSALRVAGEQGKIVVMHCRTGNRVGPAWIAWRVLDERIPLEQAVREARFMQMVTPAYEQIARDYVRNHGPRS
jgi:protein tyrosine phosphatase (PTP) superfamily phosphohydrolase (DUF442 family)